MTKLDWNKMQRNARVDRHPELPDVMRAISSRRDLTSDELAQLIREGRWLIQTKAVPNDWIKRYDAFERKAHLRSAHPELHDIYSEVQSLYRKKRAILQERTSSKDFLSLGTKIERLESVVSGGRPQDIARESLLKCHEIFEQSKASASRDERLALLVRFRRVVATVATVKISRILEMRAAGKHVLSLTALDWLLLAKFYLPAGDVKAPLEALIKRLREEMKL